MNVADLGWSRCCGCGWLAGIGAGPQMALNWGARRAVEVVGASPESVTERTVQGTPVKVLVDASEGADLLLVGNRGHGGFTGMLLGSVSGQVLAYAHCPSYRARLGIET